MSNNKESIKVYVDTCILSKLIWHAVEEKQQKALDKICEYDCIEFVTSPITLEEFNKTPQAHIRVALRVCYKLINKIPNAKFYKGGFSFPLSLPFKLLKKDKLFKKIETIFKKKDIIHIYNAVRDNCNYFLTLDYNSILNKVDNSSKELKEICPDMQFVDPKTLLEKIL